MTARRKPAAKARGIGRVVAPWRFLIFIALFAGGAALLAVTTAAPGRAIMLGFDGAALVFLLSLIPLIRTTDGKHAAEMRKRAAANDANRTLLLAINAAVIAVILVTVGGELQRGGKADTAFVLATLALAWIFFNMIYALHYAHLYYSDDDADGVDDGALVFPDTPEPHYWDFIYFSFTLGMTFQTSDTGIRTSRVRSVVLGQSMAAFLFNLGVIAFTINVLGSSR